MVIVETLSLAKYREVSGILDEVWISLWITKPLQCLLRYPLVNLKCKWQRPSLWLEILLTVRVRSRTDIVSILLWITKPLFIQHNWFSPLGLHKQPNAGWSIARRQTFNYSVPIVALFSWKSQRQIWLMVNKCNWQKGSVTSDPLCQYLF